ncbi:MULTISPECIES: ABC transporter ATP-binding protein [Clostridium]|uniref:Putative ABC transporter ATP-binding protein n=2 Tax=Clostridium TaxID=1485 RepID=A0A151AKH7_9CLOT|nr:MULTISPECIES: ABC transporter ATP-binding protein [Clostridium]KYH28121.1 putative ABC transporter ATP-binding protein [Clostridium colicanis DSM 13634]MBE6043067.1 ABC transporter ATP-binding protein [Clostridium thermopalmarium]PRR70535.1 putative ABC transporter ATP-binding protein [Clostridium thermopalmarium DSM 5974]PVZ21277.1 ATP-binding cassette subfamily B protein [Clostridium thermopalmarium DSM 5974]
MLRLFRFLRPYKDKIAACVMLLFLQVMAELYLPTLMSDIVNKGIVNGDTKYIMKIGRFMLIVAAGSSIATILANLFSSKFATAFGRDLRRMIFTKAEGFSLHEFDKIGTPSMITRTTNDITQIQQFVVVMMKFMVTAPIMAIGGFAMALSKDKKLTLVLAVSIPLLILVIFLVARKAIPLFKAMQNKVDKINLVLRENLAGIRVIRAFNRIDDEKERFREASYDFTSTAIRVNKMISIIMPMMMLIMNFTSVAIVWFGGIRIDNGNMQVGDMMAFIQYVMQIMFSFLMLAMMFVMIPRAQASADRINEVLNMEPEITDPENPKNECVKRGYVEFKDVTFNYPGSQEPAIKNISFSVNPGETTAIIGGTGSGKSTLINLIPRFYDVTSGAVLVDGIDVRNMSQKELRKKIGFVPQKAVLFTGTIEENIRYGKEDATEIEIRHAAEVAQASEFISNMKEGYDTLIAQGGNNVSGGQKQRLSIARALVGRPEIYIFDDSFSALDFKTDAKLREALKEETKNSTVIIVAQRVSTVIDADRIIVLDEGEIVGIGTHKELLKSSEVYREIVSSQLSEEELA